jgi:hypothetical protein
MNTATTVCFFEGSYQIERIVTDRRVAEDFLIYKMGELEAHRQSGKYWASVEKNGRTTHYGYKDGMLCVHAFAN